MKRVLFFGIYNREYPRNRVLIQGFEENGYEVVHCNVDPRAHKGWGKYLLLAEARFKLKGDFEFVLVAFPGHTCLWLAKLLFPGKRIVFDVFISQYEANVVDRKVHKAGTLRAQLDRFLDWYSVNLADVVLFDTFEHGKAFARNCGMDIRKAIPVFLGSALEPADASAPGGGDPFIVHYHGTFIPLHGVEFIIRAAKIIENEKGIRFRFIGSGQALPEMQALAESLGLHNVEFTGRLPEHAQVFDKMKESDVALGAFGTTDRAQWVIMNKIFEAMTFGKVIITDGCPAVRELFTDRENILMVRPGDPADLAEKILELYRNPELKKKIAAGSLELFKSKLAPKQLVSGLLADLSKKK